MSDHDECAGEGSLSLLAEGESAAYFWCCQKVELVQLRNIPEATSEATQEATPEAS